MTDLLALLPPGPPLILREAERTVLAEQALEGLMAAEAYRTPEVMHCTVPVADLVTDEGERVDQILHGEVFDLLHRQGDRGWGRARRDGVVGWVALDRIKPGAPLATRRVVAVDAALPLNALVIDGAEGVTEADLAPIGSFENDLATVAERLIGIPHALGARSSYETDCAGLVQQALLACGLPGPRRSAEQAQLGVSVATAEAARGDLVIWLSDDSLWTGHSALMIDEARVIHATCHHGCVVIEPLAEVEARLTAEGYARALLRRV
ncbi:NlpC/P60 family protein [Brevundimonas vesicularis]|uniref:C40 family peptidase n=1 Tax=Brevundimonas vesicularis TaxID=41276 RepID=UPI0038D3EB3A